MTPCLGLKQDMAENTVDVHTQAEYTSAITVIISFTLTIAWKGFIVPKSP